MHSDAFYHLFWQALTLSKWGGPLSMGPRVNAVHGEFTKGGGELLLTSPQVVISAAGEGMLIFFAWQISNIMHCQIILNMASVTRWPCSQYSDLLWLINSAATACHWTINQGPPPPKPCTFSDSSSPVSPFEYEVRLGWLPQNKPLGEHSLAKLFIRVGILIEEIAELSCANGCDNLSHLSQRFEPDLFTHYTVYFMILWTFQGFFLKKSIWTFAPNVDTHCLNRLLQNSLANKVARNERFDNVCSSLMMRTNTDRKYQALTITAHLS